MAGLARVTAAALVILATITAADHPGRTDNHRRAVRAAFAARPSHTHKLPTFASHAKFVAGVTALQDDPLAAEGGRIVTFRGNPASKVLVVGEAPGAQEDEQGVPFVGRAGKLLDEIFTAAQFNLETEVYVTNVVKRRPPHNRDPTAAELAFFTPWLLEEIRLVDPHIVVCTGRFSMRVLLGERTGITKIRGQWFRKEVAGRERWCMPLFHPSYLLRNPSRAAGQPKSLTWVDVQEVRRKHVELLCAASPSPGDAVGKAWDDEDEGQVEGDWESDCPCSDLGTGRG